MSHVKQNNQTIMINKEVEYTLQYRKKASSLIFFLNKIICHMLKSIALFLQNQVV